MTFAPLEPSDAALLEMLTASEPPKPVKRTKFARRDAALDPLLIAAAAASGPHMTRNHYAHDFLPGVQLPDLSSDGWNWASWKGSDAKASKENQRKSSNAKLAYVSRQAPRRERLGIIDQHVQDPAVASDNSVKDAHLAHSADRGSNPNHQSETVSTIPPLSVKCMARTRIPTPHGPVFLHLYHNNRDKKEHLALVVDPSQFGESKSSAPQSVRAPFIRSKSLDSVWSETESEDDRLTRGAYIGRLSSTSRIPSHPGYGPNSSSSLESVPSPLIRIHSECFTGETIGSMRCDCGEQLDEAIRQISQPMKVISSTGSAPVTLPGRGAVIYLRQEGRGIGLLSKIKAYNLQDMGHDTVAANLLLGHKADERGYEIAAAILQDLGLTGENDLGNGLRLLTNNPDKVQALEKEGVRIAERVPMIPRSWKARHNGSKLANTEADVGKKRAGLTMIGGDAAHGQDLDKYLRTKVVKMGHMLPLWMEEVGVEP